MGISPRKVRGRSGVGRRGAGFVLVLLGFAMSSSAFPATLTAHVAEVGPTTCAAEFAACARLPRRSCGQTPIPPILGASRLEIDVYGSRGPDCRHAVSQLRRAAIRRDRGRWGVLDGWRCRWRTGAESCARPHAVLWAIDPGE